MSRFVSPAYFARSRGESAYPQLWDGLVGAWCPSLGPTGGILRDWSGRAHHGTLTNMTLADAWVVSGGATAILADGSNDNIDIAHSSHLSNLSKMTVSLWFNASSWSGSPVVIGKSIIGSWYVQYFNSLLGMWFNDVLMSHVGSPSTATWHHYFCRYDGTFVTAYLNGVAGTTSATSGSVSTGTGVLRMCGYVGGGFAFNGLIDDVLIWNRDLTTHERTLLHSAGNGRGIAFTPRRRTVVRVPGGNRRRRLFFTGAA